MSIDIEEIRRAVSGWATAADLAPSQVSPSVIFADYCRALLAENDRLARDCNLNYECAAAHFKDLEALTENHERLLGLARDVVDKAIAPLGVPGVIAALAAHIESVDIMVHDK